MLLLPPAVAATTTVGAPFARATVLPLLVSVAVMLGRWTSVSPLEVNVV